MWRITLLLLAPMLLILTAATCGEEGGDDEAETPTVEAEATDTPEPEETETPEPTDQPDATATPIPPTNTPAPVTNRASCNAIRGTSYLSGEERTWFLANCITQEAPQPVQPGGGQQANNCHPSCAGACLDPNASDYDCAGGSGNGPLYTGPVQVVGPDVFDLDRDGDGQGCE